MKKTLPLILIFDIDDTLINCCNTSSYELEYTFCKTFNIKNINNIEEVSKSKYIRNDFVNFINFMIKKYKKVEIFLYSNSIVNRCNYIQEFIQNITKLNIRKTYNRTDSIDNNKYLLSIYDDIIDTLKLNKYKDIILQNNIIFIDDLPDNLTDFKNKQIECNKYKYRYYYDLQKRLKNVYNIDILKKEYLDFFINKKIPYYDINSTNIENNDLIIYNLNHSLLLLEMEENNDNFFSKLINIIKKHNFKKFNDNNIQIINREINDKKNITN